MNYYLKIKTKEGKKMKTKKQTKAISRYNISSGILLVVLTVILIVGFLVWVSKINKFILTWLFQIILLYSY